ncbi:ribosome small subunit-dependent GTPase A [Sphingomonas aliaeris]|uniref:Small ribosomal subunit biogenesis GTPase RsgA n=1 Tax=Sphingomonas aliaeris TaxID=2759526 RepID=A0A974NVI7_9SPHN|nr:ribosome small subunit-dependent GTPase A [Sphingomonas aliaeris]QQV77645.1 ribosome small subunit-dependent GTPase A [Sphingomonas aliaeris]
MNVVDTTLEMVGWNSFFSDQVSAFEAVQCRPVRVMAVHRGKIAVLGEGEPLSVTPYIAGASPSDDHPTVGDWLLIDRATAEPLRVLTRKNLFKRRAPVDRQRDQMIAANIDTVFIVASCNQDFSVARLERYLVLAREARVSPVVVLTKTDLAANPSDYAAAVRAIEPGLRVEMVDGRDAVDAVRLASYCGLGQTVALLGSSGVGKSTLVNTLLGSENIATQAIRAGDDTGRHTTTVREMHRLAYGGWLLDTPGMRELQLSDASGGIAEVFDDFILTAERCRFADCRHGSEPDCAVQTAIANGILTDDRFSRWQRLAREDIVTPVYPRRRR